MKINFSNILLTSVIGIGSFSILSHAKSSQGFNLQDPPPSDSTAIEVSPTDCTKTVPEEDYIYEDRHGDPINNPSSRSPFVIEPSNVKSNVTLLPDLSGYGITETIGDSLEYRPPTKMTPQDLAEYRRQELMRDHFRELSKTKLDKDREAGEDPIEKAPPKKEPLVNIVPAGNVTLSLGGRWQKTKNPQVPVRLQRTGGFDFDQQIQLNLLGTIGDRLKITANWNTKAQFSFDNNLKITYQAKEEDWLRDIQAGNISVPLNTQLIRGAQKLMGVKATMQFGKVGVTAFAASQQGAKETLTIKGGGLGREFEFPVSEYDVNRHFFLGHYFRDIFEQAYENNPTNPNNGFRINRVNVFITNTNAKTENLKNIIAFTDLGEAKLENLQNKNLVDLGASGDQNMSNAANTLLDLIGSDSTFRDPNQAINILQALGLQLGVDFEKINSARALEADRDFTFHPELGFLSLNSRLKDDEALAVSFEYTLNGIDYKVGELTEDYVSLDQNESIVLKLLKPARTDLSLNTWDLMMKNIYSLNTSRVAPENFQLRVIYKDDATGIDNPSLQEGIRAKDKSLLQLFGLDKLNPNNDLMPDGNFDFIENATILTDKGQIIFPTPEPFGDFLNREEEIGADNSVIGTENKVFTNEEGGLKAKYVFKNLYDNTQGQARRETEYNKFYIKGSYQSASSASIRLNGLQVDENSVTVRSGAITLNQGTDYSYSNGTITILNTGVLASGKDIIIQYEKEDLFRFRTKSLMGTRIEYNHSRDFNFGTTIIRSAEAPIVTRISVGDEPVNNTQIGADFSFAKDSRLITKMVDFLPGIQTKATSSISTSWEVAAILPGNSKILGENGTSYIDDFESAENESDFSGNIRSWTISTPPVFLGTDFNEFEDYNETGIKVGDHRGKLVWFNPDLSFYGSSIGGTKGVGNPDDHNANHYTRGIFEQEVFTRKDIQNNLITPTTTFDIHYYPRERGPYNYNVDPNDIRSDDGYFANPEKNWAGITRSITTDTDFENQNVEFIEFWMMDPFHSDIYDVFPEELDGVNEIEMGGDLFFNLGDISEDIIKDRRHGFENGLPNNVDTTEFGIVTKETFLTNAFENQVDRRLQDVGYDGLNDDSERSDDFFGQYISDLKAFVNPNAPGLASFESDPSSDNFEYYISDDNDDRLIPLRYKNYNGYENNSPTGSTEANSTVPNNEDLNNNKTLDEVDRYFQYHLPMNPDVFNGTTDHQYIVGYQPGNGVDFYQVRIPIKAPQTAVGGISNFNTIKYFRMYMTGFKHPVAIRMLNFLLVSSQWRKYTGNDLIDPTLASDSRNEVDPYPNVYISTVSIEENADYQLPPGVVRDYNQTSITQARQDEKSLQICANDIKNGDGAAAFKNITVDLINYKRIKMFIHGETDDLSGTESGDLYAFLRLGTDITQNYYEIAVPLEISPNSAASPEELWPVSNEIDIAIQDLTDTKLERNALGIDLRQKYSKMVGKYRISVVGSPDRSTIRTTMLGVENPKSSQDFKTTCVWFNELRVTDFDKSAGWATVGNLNLQLADLGSVSGSMQYTSANYGDIESKIADRTRDKSLTYGAQTNLQLHKFGADKIGLQLPFFASIDGVYVNPKFDPFDPDVLLKESIKSKTTEEAEAYKNVVTYKKVIKSINLTNVKKVKIKEDAKKHFYDIENLTVSLGYKEETRQGAEQNSTYGNAIASYLDQSYKGSANYSYNFKAKNIAPFSKAKVKSKYFTIIKDFNFSPIPSSINIQGTLNRRYFRNQLYNGDFRTGGAPSTLGVSPNYEKSFTFDRRYNMRWNLSKSLNLTYLANASALIDEPLGDKAGENGLTRNQYNDILWDNVMKLGRLKKFDQDINLTYRLPINKIPLFDWISADTKLKINYNWTASAFETEYGVAGTYDAPTMMKDASGEELGNFMQNGRDFTVNSKFDLTKLYTKSKYLKSVLSNSPTKRRPPSRSTSSKTEEEEEEETKNRTSVKNTKVVKSLVNTILMVRSVSLKYDLQQSVDMPGVLSRPQVLGLDFDDRFGGDSHFAPGYEFLLGSQNLNLIKNEAIGNNWYTRSTTINTPIQQTTKESITGKATVEPFSGFRITVDASYTKTTGFQELIKIDENGKYEITEPLFGGNVKSSFIALPTSFSKDDDENNNKFFTQFEDAREHFKNKLNDNHSAEGGAFTENSTDVLIPAFLSTYKGTNITNKNQISKKMLLKDGRLPLPNWSVTYVGLGRMPLFRKKFSSITLSHSYDSESSINNFKSSAQYKDIDYQVGLNTEESLKIDEDGVYSPLLIVNELVITERFSPLIGINVRTKKGLTLKFDYNKSRNLSLDMVSYQVTETKNNDFVFSFGVTTKKIPAWIKWKGESIPELKNNLTFKMDMTIRDQKTVARKIDDIQKITAGNLNFQFRPNLSYQYNKKMNFQLYFERTVNQPKTSINFYRATTAFGVQVRFSLT